MAEELKPVELTVVSTHTQDWEPFPIPQLGIELTSMPLMDDPDTGMRVLKLIYRAGFTNPWHTHPCAHGIYVLDGTLTTHVGTYPPAASCGSRKAGSCITAPARTATARSFSSPTSRSTSTIRAWSDPAHGRDEFQARRSPYRVTVITATLEEGPPADDHLSHPCPSRAGELRYEVRGAGPLLLITGAPMAAAYFAPVADVLADDFTVVTHDPRGISASVLNDPEQDSTPDLRADDLAALLDALGADTADVLGSSGGAITGRRYVTRHPTKVRTLIAHEPPAAGTAARRRRAACRGRRHGRDLPPGRAGGRVREVRGERRVRRRRQRRRRHSR